jgi:hypothetical protein
VKTISREELKAKMDRGDETLYCWRRSGGSVLPPGAFAGRDQAFQDTGAAAEVVLDQEAFVVAYCSDFN